MFRVINKFFALRKGMLINMNRIKTKDLLPGMILAEDIYSMNNQLILPKGQMLTDTSITKLEMYYILDTRIEEPYEDIVIDPIELSSYSKRVQSSEEFIHYKQQFDQTLSTFKLCISDIVEKNAPIDTNLLLDQTRDIIKASAGNGTLLTMLQNMRQYDDLTFAHSLNVALICSLFANWLHFSKEDIEIATLCGLLHDIGKLMIPDSIIKKPSKLTDEEYEIIKTHPIQGYQLIKDSDINEHVKNVVLMHHEKYDGSGYPFGLKDNKIDPFASIVTIADIFEAMTSARIYRGPLCPFVVIDIFVKEGFQKYDTNAILTFLNNIVTSYIGNMVRLNNKRVGEIIFINPHDLANPTVKCGDKFVDLSTHPSLYIEAII